MANKTIRVRINSDGTLTVRVGRAVEHFDVAEKTKAEIFDSVKWAIISKGIIMDDVAVTELLQEVQGR